MGLGATVYGTCCGLGYLAVSVFLGVTLVFLFISLVSLVSDLVDDYLAGAEQAALGDGARAS